MNDIQQSSIEIVCAEDINMLSVIGNITNVKELDQNFDYLYKVLSQREQSCNNVEEEIHDRLVFMHKRIICNIVNTQSDSYKHEIANLEKCLKTGSFEESLKQYKAIIDLYDFQFNECIFDNINKLLNISSFGFIQCTSCQFVYADVIDNVPVIASENSENGEFICPISYDNETDVAVLIKEGTPVLDVMESMIVSDLMKCPLSALKYPKLCMSIVERLDVAIGVPSWIIMNRQYQTSPITRDKIMGSIYFGCNKSQNDATYYTIAKLLTRQHKCIGNMDLWFIVICFLIKRLNRFDDIKSLIDKKIKYVMDNCICNASLSDSYEHLLIKVPLGMALWMMIANPILSFTSSVNDVSKVHFDTIKKLLQISGYACCHKHYSFQKIKIKIKNESI